MCKGPLFRMLGYSADTDAATQILEETFWWPLGMDPATITIIQKIARIIEAGGPGGVSIIIT